MIVVVGSIALDTIETPTQLVTEVLGGSATYICCAASKLAPTSLLGIVGNDFPSAYRELFAQWGVGAQGLEVAQGATFRWSGRYHADFIHRDTLTTELGVFEHFSPQVPAELRSAEYVILGNIHPDLQHQVLDQMTNPRWVMADTMQLWLDIARESLDRLIRRVDVLVVNDEEARNLTGQISLTAAAEDLLALGPQAIIIKRGEHGASLHTPTSRFYTGAYPLRQVQDTTGAGDSFLGGVMGWMARQADCGEATLRQAIVVGSCLASFTVESFGTTSLEAASLDTLQHRVHQLRAMSQMPDIGWD